MKWTVKQTVKQTERQRSRRRGLSETAGRVVGKRVECQRGVGGVDTRTASHSARSETAHDDAVSTVTTKWPVCTRQCTHSATAPG